VNITELLNDLQHRHDEAIARADELRGQIERLTAALTETEARLTDLATARKVIAERAPTGDAPDPPEPTTACQAILNAFNQHSDRPFRVREHAHRRPSPERHPQPPRTPHPVACAEVLLSALTWADAGPGRWRGFVPAEVDVSVFVSVLPDTQVHTGA
jgi:hypothetical protein